MKLLIVSLSSVPVSQVMVAARGATDAFSGVQRHVNSFLRKVGAKNIEAGIGCGIGFGHGFGLGLAVKPRVVHQIQSHLFQAVTHVMEKLGIASTLPINQGVLPTSFQTGTRMIKDSVSGSSFQDNVQDGKTNISLEGTLVPKNYVAKTQHGSRTEMSINNFLKNPILKEDMDLHEQSEASGERRRLRQKGGSDFRLEKSGADERARQNIKGSVPVLNQVIVDTRRATYAFFGVQRHFNTSVEDEKGRSVYVNDDNFRDFEVFYRRDRNGGVRKVEVDFDESRHPLVREVSRLIDLRIAWTPKLEAELKHFLRSLKPSQVCAVIRAQSDERVALNFFYWADRQWHYRHDPMVYHVLLQVLSKTKLCQGAKRVLRLMVRRKIELWPEDFGCVMVSFSRAGHLRKAMQVLTIMQRAGVELEISMCNTAVNVLVEWKMLEKAFRFLERMQIVGIKPNVVTYNCLIKGYCVGGRLEDAQKLISEMPFRGCSPDRVSYCTMMGYLCKEKRINELRRQLDKMSKDSRLLPDQLTYNTLIHMLCNYGHADEALRFLHEAEEIGICIDKVGHTAIINCLCRQGRMDSAKDIVEEMFSKGCNPDVVTYTAVLNGFCRLREVDKAKMFLQEMYRHGCQPNCVSFTALLSGLCQTGNSSEAREVMNMSEGWWTPNCVTYSVVMLGFRREGKLYEACNLVSEMIRKGLFPSPVEVNLLIHSLCLEGFPDRAKKFMEECLNKGCAINVVNYTTVIHGFCQKDDLDTALSVFDDMYLNNKHPDEVTYTTIIDMLGRKGRIDEAIEMSKKMLHKGLLPTPVTYRSLIHHFCRQGRVDDLLILLEKMLPRQNCRTAYNQVVEKLCSFGRIDEAYKLLGTILRTAARIDANSCHVLMKSFLKNGDPLGSYRVACRMFNRNLIPDLKLCEKVSKRLILEEKLEEADKLMLRFVERGHVAPQIKPPVLG